MNKSHLSTDKLLLYLLDELPENQRKAVEEHLNSCQTCRQNLENEGSFHQTIFEHGFIPHIEFPYDTLRKQLMSQIKRKTSRKPIQYYTVKLRNLFPKQFERNQILVYASILLFGLYLGHSIDQKSGKNGTPFKSRLEEIESLISPVNIEIFQDNEPSRKIGIHYKMFKEETIHGGTNDSEIQKALIYVLMYHPKDNIRLDAIELLQEGIKNQLTYSGIAHALENDVNPGIRLKAIRLLKDFPYTHELKKVVIRSLLLDPNQGVRFEAAKILNQNMDEETKKILEIASQDNTYIHYLTFKNQTKSLIENISIKEIKK